MARPKSEDKRDALMAAATRVIAAQGLSAPTAVIAGEHRQLVHLAVAGGRVVDQCHDDLDDASVVQPGVYKKDRQEIQSTMAGGFAGPLKGSRVIDQPRDVRFLNEDTAIVISEGGIVFPGQNAVPSEGTVRATWVLAKRDGRWLVAAYHYSGAN